MNQQVLFAHDVFVQLTVHVDFARADRACHLAFGADQQIVRRQLAAHVAIDHGFAGSRDRTFECDAFANQEVVVGWIDIGRAIPFNKSVINTANHT